MKQLLQSIDGNRICLGVSNVNEHEILRSLPIRINAQGRRHGNAAQEKRESDTPGCDRKDVAGVKPQKIEQLFSFFFLFCFFRKLQYRPFNYDFHARKKALAYNRDYL